MIDFLRILLIIVCTALFILFPFWFALTIYEHQDKILEWIENRRKRHL